MDRRTSNYLLLIFVHVLMGVAIFLFHPLSKVCGYGIILVGLFYVIKSRNANHEALIVGAYMVGSEAFLRMTQGNPVYEFSKYGIMAFLLIGMYFRGFSKNAIPYWLFLALLVPGVVIGTYDLDYKADLAKIISFNISGSLCLSMTAMYCYRRPFTFDQINRLLLYVGLPIVMMTTYLLLYTPSIRDVVTGTSSNYETSGGFGPNQVSTALGLGMFIFFSRMFLVSANRLEFIVNLLLGAYIGYRGLITFSRGGMVTGFCMLIMLVLMTYVKINSRGRTKFNVVLIFFSLMVFSVWSFSSFQTGGMLDKRYANEDAAGRVKKSHFTGREQISETEIEFFLTAPVLGIGVGKGVERRTAETGTIVLSHSEVTRLMAEHGSLGIMCLLILIATPLVLYLDNKQHIYMASFVCFWLLTINHAAMRLAAPAFIYGLSVLQIIRTDVPGTAVRRQ
jgi:hypothetical protein